MAIRKIVVRMTLLIVPGIIFGLALSPRAYSQDFTRAGYQQPGYQQPGYQGDYYNNQNVITNPYETDDDEGGQTGKKDTVRRERRPLESFFFDDSTRNRHNFAWNVDTYRNRVELVDIDTLIDNFQLTHPAQREGLGDALQGNLGGATIPLNYFDRPRYGDFAFAQAYDTYHFSPENVMFFNVKQPFTSFNYMTAGQKTQAEENFRITHAQNASPSTGFNIDYKSRGTRGMYIWSKARAKNLSMAFSHTGKKYSLHAGYIYNTINNKENGGLADDRFLTDTILERSDIIPVRLNDARNVFKNNAFFVTQSYGIPLRRLTDEDFSIADRSSVFIGHSFQYSRWVRNYTDTRANTFYTDFDGTTRQFYENWYIDPTATRDSIAETRITNRVFIQMQPWSRDAIVGVLDAGVGMDNHRFFNFTPDQFVSGLSEGKKETSYYVYGSVEGQLKKYLDWGGDVAFHPAGYRLGDINIGAHASVSAFIRGNPITLTGKFSHDRRSPNYWSENFFSNHYVWLNNSFDKEDETRLEAALSIPSADFEVWAGQSVVSNKIYYDRNGIPAQNSGSVSVTGAYARKYFRLGGFNLNHRVLLQWSTSREVIPVPLVSVYLSYFYEFDVVKDVLRVQFGIDGRYNTKYYAPGWNPATATFYNQREKQVGEYPMLDLFVNAKWKRMRILLKFEHLNDDLFGSRNFFMVPHYPLNRRVFKIGFSWSFYD